MASRSTGVEKEIRQETDDFKQIHGIGPGIENRLHNAGITTYAQLSALSSDEIVSLLGNLIGMTVERVNKQDWIGQAQKLQADREQALGELQRDETRQSDLSRTERQHYATFTLELLLGGDEVRRTRIVHIQSNAEETWAGWEEGRVFNFIVRCAEFHPHKVEPAQLETEMIKATQPENLQLTLAGQPRLDELVAILAPEGRPSRFIPASQSFGVRMTLDFSEILSPRGMLVDHSTTILAKELGSGKRLLVGEAKGSFMPEEKVTVGIDKVSLPEGLFRLEAIIVLELHTEGAIPCPGITTQVVGDLVRID